MYNSNQIYFLKIYNVPANNILIVISVLAYVISKFKKKKTKKTILTRVYINRFLFCT